MFWVIFISFFVVPVICVMYTASQYPNRYNRPLFHNIGFYFCVLVVFPRVVIFGVESISGMFGLLIVENIPYWEIMYLKSIFTLKMSGIASIGSIIFTIFYIFSLRKHNGFRFDKDEWEKERVRAGKRDGFFRISYLRTSHVRITNGEVYILPAVCVLDSERTRDLGVMGVETEKFPADKRAIIRYRPKVDEDTLPQKVREYYHGTEIKDMIEVFLPDKYGEFTRRGWMDGNKVREFEAFKSIS